MFTKQNILANLIVTKSSSYHYISIPDFPKKMMTNKKSTGDVIKCVISQKGLFHDRQWLDTDFCKHKGLKLESKVVTSWPTGNLFPNPVPEETTLFNLLQYLFTALICPVTL